ncbi:helix-turn-helix domain-containing protein [Mycobacteroides abscessus]|uniref:helix-turn-helix domain-containing protein n=1 Tax=Mycobacteroides abscessus TaxID=36809 RepID=UPI0009A5DF97|nr:helix-turn-helix domain-containing protein [Mycobacteroides abscessus]SKT85829.1 Uncharacterised protein [Mycobacteroides abscessus subsp. massiliense]SKU05040.1 Uncharacterised protein [Mycobacteroides abscessus subsp. massiliense]
MDAPSFRNNTRFASTMKFLREALKLDISEVDKEGGPARSYVTNIERGDDMPITDDTISKYAAAFSSAKPRTLLDAADPSLESFLRSYATLFKAFEDFAATSERDARLTEERKWSPEKQNMAAQRLFIGINVLTDEPMWCDVLTAPEHNKGDRRVRSIPAAITEYENRGGVDHMLLQIAQDQPALTLIPHTFATSANFISDKAWIDWSLRGGKGFSFGVNRSAFSKAVIDPIANVTSLYRALQRAEILGANGTDMVTLAWAILGANAAADRTGHTPIECLDDIAEIVGRAEEKIAGTVPEPLQIRTVTEKYLLPWALQYTVATWDVRFDVEPDPDSDQLNTVTWVANRLHDSGTLPAASVTGYAVCLYDREQFPRLAEVLADLNRPAITYTPGRLAGDEHRAQTAELCPVGPHPAFGLVRAAGTNEWTPVQLYSAQPPSYEQVGALGAR